MTNLLLDTHAFIWYAENDSKLPESIKIEIETADRLHIRGLQENKLPVNQGKL